MALEQLLLRMLQAQKSGLQKLQAQSVWQAQSVLQAQRGGKRRACGRQANCGSSATV